MRLPRSKWGWMMVVFYLIISLTFALRALYVADSIFQKLGFLLMPTLPWVLFYRYVPAEIAMYFYFLAILLNATIFYWLGLFLHKLAHRGN